LYEYYGNETTKSKETYFLESEFDFRVDQKCNLYYGYLFIARIRGFSPQPENYSTDSSVKSQLYATYLQIMLQQKHISERLDDSEKNKDLGLAKEMYRLPQ
jgi:phage major head subunit gpT-like protein